MGKTVCGLLDIDDPQPAITVSSDKFVVTEHLIYV